MTVSSIINTKVCTPIKLFFIIGKQNFSVKTVAQQKHKQNIKAIMCKACVNLTGSCQIVKPSNNFTDFLKRLCFEADPVVDPKTYLKLQKRCIFVYILIGHDIVLFDLKI